jgi:histidinol-phosphatase (PHP family)
MKIDTHIHSVFSPDGHSTQDEMCLAAIARGFDVICFTEHFDMNPHDTGYGFFDYEKYSEAMKASQDKYSGKIKILKGLEFSEPHQYVKELEKFNAQDFDFILGSVHWVNDNWIGDKKYSGSLPVAELFTRHYRETLKACETGLFDSLAHIDFPVRYLPESFEDIPLLEGILDAIIEKGISLEINTSPLRKGMPCENPSKNIQKMYLDKGGKYFTIGSDAHNAKDVGAYIDKVSGNQDYGYCYYEKRKRVTVLGGA